MNTFPSALSETMETPAAMPPPPELTPPPDPPRRGGALRSTIIAAVVASMVAAGTTLGLMTWTSVGRTDTVAAVQAAAPVARGDAPSSWAAAIAQAVSPAVARINVTTAQGRGEGSAVIYRADGYLLTNNHVVENATKLNVTLPSGKSYDATVVGTDPATDIGVIKVDATDLPVASLATAEPRIGDQVLAIGTPFGLSGTVTEGIISAKGRTVDTPNAPLTDMIQTDAAINPGNSGGALVNSQGEVVGINTAILSPSGTNNGIGFAIPITAARSIAEQLITNGSVEHGFLGINGQTVDAEIASTYNLGVDHGAVVSEVQPGSPAADAGLQQGDIITAVDGNDVKTMEDLAGALIRHQPGDEVDLHIYRQSRQMDMTATLGEAPAVPATPRQQAPGFQPPTPPLP